MPAHQRQQRAYSLQGRRLADEQALGVPVSALGEQLWRAANAAMGEGACVLDVVRWYEQTTGVELKD